VQKQSGKRWEPWVKDRGPGFFLTISFLYLVVLVLLLLGRQFAWFRVERLPSRMGDIVPLAIPWFGALGAVLISIYGVFDHNADSEWDPTYDYWHLFRPFVGAVLGTVAYLIFLGFVNASTQGTAPIPHDSATAIPYLVISFVVGFREDTFPNSCQAGHRRDPGTGHSRRDATCGDHRFTLSSRVCFNSRWQEVDQSMSWCRIQVAALSWC
jgi:hypothetical protein